MTTDRTSEDETVLLGPEARRSADMEAVWTRLLDEDAAVPDWLDLPPSEARTLQDGLARRWNAVLPEVERVEVLDAAAGLDRPAHLIVPVDAAPGCVLFLHGGGWAFGNLETHQRFMRLLAIATGHRVLGIDYRLAPEHPYPAPLDDARAAWRWLTRQGATRPDFDGPLVIAGDSAGANLAMGVMIDAIREDLARPAAALLFYGAFEAGTAGRSYARFAEGFGLTRAGMARFWDVYVPDAASRVDPLVSALLAPDDLLRRLPPVFLNAAGLDPLLSDTLALARRLAAIGVPHQLEIHAGVHHGFMQMSLWLPEAQVAIDAAARFVRAATATA